MSELNNEMPELTPEGEKILNDAINKFKEALTKQANEIIGITMTDIYCDVNPWLESDLISNMRVQMLKDLCDYNYLGEHDKKPLRRAIFKENHDLIIKELNQDLVEENKRLLDMLEGPF